MNISYCILFTLLFNVFSFLAMGQEVILIGKEEKITNITDRISILEDEKNKFGIGDMFTEEVQTLFVKNEVIPLELGTTDKLQLQSIWVKFELKNLSNDKVYLEIDNIDIPYCEIYVPSPSDFSKYEKKAIGIFAANPTKEIDLNYYLVSLLSAQDTSQRAIYLRFQQKGVRQVRLRIGNLPHFFQRSHDIDVFYGIFFGIVLMTFFYNLFIYASFRDKIYVWYSFYVITRGALTLANQGYGSNFFWFNFSSYNEQIIVGIFHICILSFLVFSILFLETSKRTPFWHKGLVALIILLIISFLISLVNFYVIIIFWQIAAVFIFIYVFILSIYIYWLGYKTVRFYILANIFFILGLFIIILRVNQLIPPNLITINTYPFGVVTEIILFFLALADKIKILREERKQIQEENLRLVQEQNEKLEQKVKERTKELEKANDEISMQNEELQQSHEQLNMLNEELITQRNNLAEMNDHLEDLVTQKTQQLQKQNQQLADYAYFNSHKVRGALARVLGLCMILEQTKDEINATELFDLVAKIFISAKELDVFVKEINIILNRDLEKELNQFKQA